MNKKFKILLIGDSCIDEYHYGVCERLSPEAPVPVVSIKRSETKPGMAANVYENLISLGCEVDFVTSEVKSIKKRYIDERSGQHMIRIDEDLYTPPLNPDKINFIHQYDALVISDYNKGFISDESLVDILTRYSWPVFIDTKKNDLKKLKKSFVKINDIEYKTINSKNENLIITMGAAGAKYKNKTYPAPKVETVDVCGAGDTFLAALTVEYLITKDIEKAIKFANYAGALTVTHNGVYAPTVEEITQFIKQHNDY